jgi:hypothetical protein
VQRKLIFIDRFFPERYNNSMVSFPALQQPLSGFPGSHSENFIGLYFRHNNPEQKQQYHPTKSMSIGNRHRFQNPDSFADAV